MNKFLIAGNWKMNKNIGEAVHFANQLKAMKLENEDEIAVIAPFTQLPALKEALKDTDILVGAQNVHYEKSGAYTGEISVDMLKEIGIDCCIVGHSERRQYFAETDETVNKKIKALLEGGIKPILCVGESLEVREQKAEQAFVSSQIFGALSGLTPDQVSEIVIAYEPIWAIGTGKTATPSQAEDMCGFIRGIIAGFYGEAVAANMIIQYGGSMKPENAEELLSKEDINGGLIGGASLKVKSFAEIIKCAYKLKLCK